MSLPLELWGSLEPGIHSATWAEVKAVFGQTAVRTALMEKAYAGLCVLRDAGCKEFLLDGSFVSAKADPNDLDVLWLIKGVDHAKLPEAFIHPEVALNRQWLKQKYGLDCFPFPDFDFLLETFSVDRNGLERGLIRVEATSL